MSNTNDFITLAGINNRAPEEKQHVGYDIEFIDGTTLTTDITQFEVFPGVSLLFLFSDAEDQHIESAYSMNTIKTIEARYK